MTCNAQPVVAKSLRPVFFVSIYGKSDRAVARINPDRRILAVPVQWRRLAACGAWTFDLRTWEHYRRSFDIVHFHVREAPHEVIYTAAAGLFDGNQGHTSHRCNDKHRFEAERLHLDREYFTYDRDDEAALIAFVEGSQQGALPMQ